MTHHTEAPTPGTTKRKASHLGRIFRGAFATRAFSPGAKGSGAHPPRRRRLAVFAASVLTGLVALTAVGAQAYEVHEYRGSFGPDGTSATEFTYPGPLAFDQQQSVLYVLDQEADELLKFDAAGHPVAFTGTGSYISGNRITGLSLAPRVGETQVAVDSTKHVFYVTDANQIRAFHDTGEPADFTAGPGAGTNLIGGFTAISGLAVDSSGAIYASDKEAGTVTIYAASGEVLTQFSATEPANLAVDSTGAVYVNKWQDTVRKFSSSEFPVTSATTYSEAASPLDPTRSYSVAVDPATNDVYLTHEFFAPGVSVFAEDGTLLGNFGGPGEEGELKSSEGIVVDPGDERVFVSNESRANVRQVEIFAPPLIVEPSIEVSSVLSVSSDSAELRALINPNRSDTSYRFEYGLEDCAVSSCESVPFGGAAIGSGHTPVWVTQQIAGLEPGTTYHYRVIAQNSIGITEGDDGSFTTQMRSFGFQLSDSRAWEMVSPPDKHGAYVRLAPTSPFEAATDGNGVVFDTVGSLEPRPEGNRSGELSPVLARRGSDGWRVKDISVPHTEVGEIKASDYKMYTPDLAKAVIEPLDGTLLSPEASERTTYLRENTEPPVYTPLVTSKEGYANVPAGTIFGTETLNGRIPVPLEGATPDLSHIVIASRAPLVEGAQEAALYEWSEGRLEPVSKLPGEGGNIVRAVLGSREASIKNAISSDGSRVFWSTEAEGGFTALYMHSEEGGQTVRLDVPDEGVSGGTSPEPLFQGASADGTSVFFTDSQRLTADASASGSDLYRCEIPAGPSPGGCASIADITVSVGEAGESAEVQGIAPAINEDGSRVYFVAKGLLDESSLDPKATGKPKLYMWQKNDGVRFIATLSPEDYRDWGVERTNDVPTSLSLSATASSDGRYLAFMSERSLTGSPNLDAISGQPEQEVFRYDASGGELVCVSCNPTGASSIGTDEASSITELTQVDMQGLWGGRWVAAMLPEAVSNESSVGYPYYRPRAVSDDGRVFFNAHDSLVPADSNGQWDVYEYETAGVGSCTLTASGSTVARSGPGCVSLISSGTGEEESALLDVSATGDDVFFVSSARLSALDEDTITDVYDARVDGVPATLSPIAECLGEACQPAANPPNDQTPASASFKGQGNPKPNVSKRCGGRKRMVHRKGRTRCVAKHRRHHRKHHRARRNWGAHR